MSYASNIEQRKLQLSGYLEGCLHNIVQYGSDIWSDRVALDNALYSCLQSHPVLERCSLIYALDSHGMQVSSHVYPDRIDAKFHGQDLSTRPYFSDSLPLKNSGISTVYISRSEGCSCISVTKTVFATSDNKNTDILGYIVADFNLLSLPFENTRINHKRDWLQLKGDPSIRSTVFMQSRVQSTMDKIIDDTMTTASELMLSRGVFCTELHFSSSRSNLWLYNDPYRCRVHTLDEFSNACLVYPKRAYPKNTMTPAKFVSQIFKLFKTLRFADDIVYLRAASLNIISGMVGLNFSCDGTHYLPAEEFLDKGASFWMETA